MSRNVRKLWFLVKLNIYYEKRQNSRENSLNKITKKTSKIKLVYYEFYWNLILIYNKIKK